MITWFDLETTGLIKSDDQITQIAAVTTDNEFEVINEFQKKLEIQPLRAEQLLKGKFDTNYDPEVWAREAVNPRDGIMAFIGYLRRHSTVHKTSRTGARYKVAKVGGHNVMKFDMPFLSELAKYRWMERKSPSIPWDWCALDTYPLSIWAEVLTGKEIPHALQSLSSFFEIDSGRAHDALNDIYTTIQIAEELIRLINKGIRQ